MFVRDVCLDGDRRERAFPWSPDPWVAPSPNPEAAPGEPDRGFNGGPRITPAGYDALLSPSAVSPPDSS
jgi:hypothetical protein